MKILSNTFTNLLRNGILFTARYMFRPKRALIKININLKPEA